MPGTVTADADRPTVARGSAPLFWAQVAGNLGLLVALVPITRALGPTGRGTVAFVTVTAIVSATVARLGVTEAMTVFAARRPRERPVLLANVLLSVTVAETVAAGLVCGALLALPAIRPPGVGDPELIVLACGMLASGLADAGYMFVLGCSRFRLHAAVTVAMAWGYAFAIALVALTAGLTVWRAVALWAAFQAVKALLLIAASVRAEGLAGPRLTLLRECVAFGLGAWIGTLSTAFNQRLDQVLVALIASEAVLGIYATAVNSFEILLYLAGAASTAILPLGARTGAGARAAEILRTYRAVTMLTAAGAVIAALLGTQLIPLVFGAAFDGSQGPFLLLLPGAFGFVALSIFSSALVAAFAPRRSSAGPVVSLVCGIALDVVLIPHHGASGAAIATTTALLAGGATSMVLYATRDRFALRELVVPRRSDLSMLGALARPFARGAAARRAAPPHARRVPSG